jgi:hypothetical protein
MELNVHFPLRDNKDNNLLLLNYFHIILSKVLQRVMITGIGFGFPAYLISRIMMFGKGEKINKDLQFMIAGCKLTSRTSRIIPILVILRKFAVVLYVLPCCKGQSMILSLLVIFV